MQRIAGYLYAYISYSNKKLFLYILLILSVLITANYYFNLNDFAFSRSAFRSRFVLYFLLFAPVFVFTYATSFVIQRKPFPKQIFFYLLLLAAPAIFAIKVALQTPDLLPTDYFPGLPARYLNIVLQWPLKAIVVVAAITLLWLVGGFGRPVSGLSSQNFKARPYFLMLAVMAPLVMVVSTAEDFQLVYPKFKMVAFAREMPFRWLSFLVFEVCYALDFFTIELFFRGFLILAFMRYAGKDAILPMAVFYCTIHFGKPLFECISSFFGGLILGVLVYHSRSIWGGLIVHLGIAGMMEVMGVIK